jgi:hypothetical protein
MFALDPIVRSEDNDVFAHDEQREIVAYHEAGHAVAQYALGAGLSRISLRTKIKNDSERGLVIGYSGICYSSVKFIKRNQRLLDQRQFDELLFIYGVATAAGPAAERKYCLMNGVPLQTLKGIEGDYATIDVVERLMEEVGRDGADYLVSVGVARN